FSHLRTGDLRQLFIVQFTGEQLRQPGVNTGNLLCCQRGHDFTCDAGTYSHCATISTGPLNAVTCSTAPLYFSISTSVVCALFACASCEVPMSMVSTLRLPYLHSAPGSPPLSGSYHAPS